MARAPTLLLALLGACGPSPAVDASALDAGSAEAGLDAGRLDAGRLDAGGLGADGSRDGGASDASGSDAGAPGTFSLAFTVRLDPAVSVFDPLTRRPADCALVFERPLERASGPMRTWTSASSTVRCAPDPPEVTGWLAASLDGQPAELTVFGGAAARRFTVQLDIAGREGGADVYALAFECETPSFPNDGVRTLLGPFSCDGGALSLERYRGTVSPATLIDRADADAALTFAR